MTDPVFNMPGWDGHEREVALVWRLKRHDADAECRLWTHPVGAQIRVDVEGEFMRSEAGRDPLQLVELAGAWKMRFQEKGWASG